MAPQTSAEKAGEVFARFPRFRLQGLVNRGGGTLLASYFGKGEALAEHLRNDQIESVGVG